MGRDEIAYEMLERARLRAAEPDLAAVTTVEDQLEAGHESSRSMLEDDLSPEILRSRLRERP